MAPKPTTRIGVLLVDQVQVLDLSPIDIFGMLSESYLSNIPLLPAPLKAGAIPMEILYINQAGPNTIQDCTAQLGLRIDASISDEKCAPAKKGGDKTLDILLIPGPDPFEYKPNDAMSGFIKGHFDNGTDVLAVCTGQYATGHAGLLKGKRATGPRMLVPELKKKFPEAIWEDKRLQLTSDLCVKGGITNGQDMVAAYLREKWPGPTVEAILDMADVGDRPQEYGSSKNAESGLDKDSMVKALQQELILSLHDFQKTHDQFEIMR